MAYNSSVNSPGLSGCLSGRLRKNKDGKRGGEGASHDEACCCPQPKGLVEQHNSTDKDNMQRSKPQQVSYRIKLILMFLKLYSLHLSYLLI